jgi:uncharacterized membrane protein
MDEAAKTLLTVSALLFGFLFTAFWWILNRELRFKPEQRHFKLATAVLMLSMLLLGVFGIGIPIRHAAKANPELLWACRGVFLALVSVYGYMFIDLGHYYVYKFPKYTTRSEWFFFALTLILILFLILRWSVWQAHG